MYPLEELEAAYREACRAYREKYNEDFDPAKG